MKQFIQKIHLLLFLFCLPFPLLAKKAKNGFSAKPYDSFLFDADHIKEKEFKSKKFKGRFWEVPTVNKEEGTTFIKSGNIVKFNGEKTGKLSKDKFSLSVWVKIKKDSEEKNQLLIGFVAHSGKKTEDSGWALEVKGETGKRECQFKIVADKEGDFTSVASAKGLFKSGQWNNIVATYDGKRLKMYLNSKLVDEEELVGEIKYTRACQLTIAGSEGNGQRAEGDFHRFDLFKTALSPKQVKEIYLATPKKLHKETYFAGIDKISWKYSKKSASKKSLKMKPSKFASPLNAQAERGKKGLKFGKDQFCSIKGAKGKLLPTDQFTLEAWVKPQIVAKGGILSSYSLSSKTGWSLYVDSDQHGYFKLALSEKATVEVKTARKLTPLAWHHLAAVFDGKKVSLYLNGKKQASESLKGFVNYDESNQLLLGAMLEANVKTGKAFKQNFQGEIAQFALTAKAYKSKSMRKKYNAMRKSLRKDSQFVKSTYKKAEFDTGRHFSYYKETALNLEKIVNLKAEKATLEFTQENGTIEAFAYYFLGYKGKLQFLVEGDKSARLYINGKVAFQNGKAEKKKAYIEGYLGVTLLHTCKSGAKLPKIFVLKENGEKVEMMSGDFVIADAQKHYPVVKLSSDLKAYGSKLLENVNDNNINSYFLSSTPIQEGQEKSIKLELAKAVTSDAIDVIVGQGEKKHDNLLYGILEISPDGVNFEKIAEFSGKALKLTFAKRSIKVLRIRINNPHKNWIAIQEIKIKSAELAKP